MTEDELQNFLSENKLIDVESQANLYTEQLRQLQDELVNYMVQKRYFDYASEYLRKQTYDELIIAPSAMGVQDALLNQIIMNLSSAQSQRANLIENNQERNPLVERLTIQIENLKQVITENIRSASESNEIAINWNAPLIFVSGYFSGSTLSKIDSEFEIVNLPGQFTLQQNYPNPFNSRTKIEFTLINRMNVRIELFDIRGSYIKELLNKECGPGNHGIFFSAESLSSGIYWYKVSTETGSQSKKMVLIK